VTEAVTGIDLVHWQLRIARGESLQIDPRQALTPHGHAIECRVYAEDPDTGFLPSPGRVVSVAVPSGPGVRDDRGVENGDDITIFYDPLIAKLTVWGASRGEAIERLSRALDEYRVAGVRTTLPFFRWLVRQPAFRTGGLSTAFLDEVLATRREPFVAPSPEAVVDGAFAAAVAIWSGGRRALASASLPASRWHSIGRRERLR
jgi:acetyl/propionyl-CoA carboxylase alpha subunit